jgi:hypothetical protein
LQTALAIVEQLPSWEILKSHLAKDVSSPVQFIYETTNPFSITGKLEAWPTFPELQI